MNLIVHRRRNEAKIDTNQTEEHAPASPQMECR